jgi:hypothetical protein
MRLSNALRKYLIHATGGEQAGIRLFRAASNGVAQRVGFHYRQPCAQSRVKDGIGILAG